MAKEDFDLFWKTHLVTASQGIQIPEVTVLYWTAAKEETSNYPWTRREGTVRAHATAAVARDLLTQVRVATRKNILSVTLIQNYSPCAQCVEELLKTIALAKEKRIKYDISLTFVGLNRIRRPSWIWRGLGEAIHGVTINESNDNSLALRQLQDAGVKLSTFNPDTWKFLYSFLGNGLPTGSPGKFLGGKYSNAEMRLEEDRLVHVDLTQVLKGLQLASPSLSQASTELDLTWSKPVLPRDKVTEFRIIVKKVTIKNKEDDEKSWRIHQTIDKTGVLDKVPSELTFKTVTDLDMDSFYDVTVEAVAKGVTTASGRKLYKTGNKVAIQSLQAPTPLRRTNSGTTRPRAAVDPPGSPATRRASASPALRRSNSTLGASRSSIASEASVDGRLSGGATDIRRWNSLRTSTGRPSAGVTDASSRRKTSDTERPVIPSPAGVNGKGGGRKISSNSVGSGGSGGM